MAQFTVQIERIQFHRNDTRGEDGAVLYLFLQPCRRLGACSPRCVHVCATHPEMEHHYARQAFRRGPSGYRLDSTPEEQAQNFANVWGWDGDTAAPTLTPSYLVHEGVPFRMHSYLTKGQLQLLADSTVVHHPAPKQCKDRVPGRAPVKRRAKRKTPKKRGTR